MTTTRPSKPGSRCPGVAGRSRGTSIGIVKLLGVILSPGNRRYFPDVIATASPFRRPALSPLFQPNSRIAAVYEGTMELSSRYAPHKQLLKRQTAISESFKHCR